MCRPNIRKSRITLSSTALIGGALFLLAPMSGVRAEEAAFAGQAGETIVVVAKRAQNLESVAGGVTLVDGSDLEDHQITRTDDLQRILPGLTINMRANRAYSNITVRGISSPDYFSPAMQIYVDGAPQTPAAFTQPLIDVERVEYLRGPQGTLYGANALGGIINITTRQPRENRGYVQGSLATRAGSLEAAGTLVLSPDSLFLDAALFGERRFGRIDDISTGDKNIDTASTLSGRIALRYAPEGGSFDARLSFARERMRSHEELYLIDDHAARLEYESADYGPIPFLERDMTTLSGQMNWHLGENTTLSSFTSWQDNDLTRDFPGRAPGFLFNWPQREKALTQEVRLVHDGEGPIGGVIGLWYQDDSFTNWKNGYPGYYGEAVSKIISSTIAGFADIALRPLAGLEISAGARVSHDRTRITATREDTYGYGMGYEFDRKANYDGFQPRFTASYAMMDELRIFGVIARGYKPGGYNHSISSIADAEPYDPETATNYELGARAAGLLDGQLDLSLSAYLIRSHEKQIYVGMIGQQMIRNAGKAESKGIEFEMAWRPATGFDIMANLTLGKSRFTDFVDPDTGISYTGNHVPYAPDVTARLLVGYTLPVDVLGGALAFNAALSHNSRSWFDEANAMSQGPVTTLDLGADLKLGSGSTLRLFVNNVTDTIVKTSGYVYDRSYWTVDPGRNIGVTLRQEL